MKVWHKILIAPGVAIAFLLALGITVYSVLIGQQHTLSELFEQRFTSYQLAARSVHDIGEVHSGVYRLFSVIGSLSDDRIKQTASGLLSKVDAVSRDVAAFAARSERSPEERRAAAAVGAKLAKYRKDVDLAIDLSAGDVNTGAAAMQTADADFQDMAKQFDELVALETRGAQEDYDDARAAFAKVTVALVILVAAALLISISISLFMSRRIVQPLQRAIVVARRIAGGDLTSGCASRVPTRRRSCRAR
jgi:methyl-accepting chemotaxis protein